MLGHALLVVPDGGASGWTRVVAGYGHAKPLGRLYIFFQARRAAAAAVLFWALPGAARGCRRPRPLGRPGARAALRPRAGRGGRGARARARAERRGATAAS
jgi:hypothetical protein